MPFLADYGTKSCKGTSNTYDESCPSRCAHSLPPSRSDGLMFLCQKGSVVTVSNDAPKVDYCSKP